MSLHGHTRFFAIKALASGTSSSITSESSIVVPSTSVESICRRDQVLGVRQTVTDRPVHLHRPPNLHCQIYHRCPVQLARQSIAVVAVVLSCRQFGLASLLSSFRAPRVASPRASFRAPRVASPRACGSNVTQSCDDFGCRVYFGRYTICYCGFPYFVVIIGLLFLKREEWMQILYLTCRTAAQLSHMLSKPNATPSQI